jgi:hypothetical protein
MSPDHINLYGFPKILRILFSDPAGLQIVDLGGTSGPLLPQNPLGKVGGEAPRLFQWVFRRCLALAVPSPLGPESGPEGANFRFEKGLGTASARDIIETPTVPTSRAGLSLPRPGEGSGALFFA